MKACIPTEGPGGLTAELSAHFGSADSFTIVDMESGEVEIITNQHTGHGSHGHGHHGSGGCGGAGLVAARGVDAVVCGSIGRGAIATLAPAAIYQASGGTVRDLLAALRQGRLEECSEGCAGHRHHHR